MVEYNPHISGYIVEYPKYPKQPGSRVFFCHHLHHSTNLISGISSATERASAILDGVHSEMGREQKIGMTW